MAQYAEIVEIVAPSQAAPGDLVNITVRIKNLYSDVISIMVAGVLEYGGSLQPGISFTEYSANVDAGAIYSFNGSFTMPDSAVTIHAYSYWYGSDGYWHSDDELTRLVNKMAVSSPTISEFKIADFARI